MRYEKVSQRSHRKLDADDIEMGYEVAKGKYVAFSKQELSELKPRSTRTIEVTDFVALDEIDPIYYERTYWLAPVDAEAAQAYRLLSAAIEDRTLVGIGAVVMRNKQYLAAVRPLEGVIAMSTLRFADEVVPRSSVPALTAHRSRPDAKQMRLALQIIDALEAKWKPSNYHDTYTEELRRLINRRSKGETITIDESPAESVRAIDLMSALTASVAAAKRSRRGQLNKSLERAAKALTASDGEVDTRSRSRAPAKRRSARKRVSKRRAPSGRGAR